MNYRVSGYRLKVGDKYYPIKAMEKDMAIEYARMLANTLKTDVVLFNSVKKEKPIKIAYAA
jgi:hypothetical protein